MQSCQGFSQRCELRVAPLDLQVLRRSLISDGATPSCPASKAYPRANRVDYVPAATLEALACVSDQDREVGILVENLLDTTVVTTGFPSGGGVIFGIGVDRLSRIRLVRRLVLAG
jgi:hypothetical protein